MKYHIAKTIGLNTDQQAAQAISSTLDADNAFLAVIDLTCDDAFTRGRSLLSELQDSYLQEEGTPAEKLIKIFDLAKSKLGDVEKYSILLAAISGKVLYLLGQGEVEAILKRQQALSPLLNGGDGQIISGFLESGDRVLFATKELTQFLGDDFKKSLMLNLPDWEDEITSRISSPVMEEGEQPKNGMAGLLLEVEQESEQDVATPLKLPETKTASSSETAVSVDESAIEEEVNIPASPTQEESSLAYPSLRDNTRKTLPFLPILARLKSLVFLNKKGRLVIAVVLILVLVAGLGLKFKASKDKQRDTQIQSLLTEARDDFNTATNLQMLNPTEANNKLTLAKDKVSQALKLDSKNKDALNLQKQMDAEGQAIAGKFASSQFDTFLDLDLVKSGFKADNFSLDKGNMAILDSNNKTLAQINVTKKSNQILAGKDQLGQANKLSINDGDVFIYSTDKGVISVDSGNQKVSSVAKADSEWGQIQDLAGFGGNIYLLDNGKNQIWKYLPTSSGYSDKRPYLSSDIKADFGNAIKMQIDSSVYVLKQDGSMLRFTKGATDNFSYSGLDKGVKDPKSFFVSADTDNLYLLDSGNARLLVLSKTGEFKMQYQGDKFATTTDLAVDEQGKKIYLLDGSKIFQVELK